MLKHYKFLLNLLIVISLFYLAKDVIAADDTFVSTTPIHCAQLSKSNFLFNEKFVKFMKNWQVPGASVTVMHQNKILLSCGYGWANLEERKPMLPHYLFRIGSISKTITAIAILKLIEQNQLRLEDKVFQILSELKPHHDKTNSEIDKITILNLLQMSSGWYSDRLQDYEPMFGPWSNEMLNQLNYAIPPDCKTAAGMMMNMPLQFTPGTKFSYSNLNYCLLGLVINHVSHIKESGGYQSFIQQTLLTPLDIHDMQIGAMESGKTPQEVKYYAKNINSYSDIDRTLDGLPYGTTDLLNKNFSDGGWIASSIDLTKIMQALFDHKILNSKSLELMKSRPSYSDKKTGYPAIGWDEITFDHGKRYMSKTGSFTGTKAFILQSDDGVSYAALFNVKPDHNDQFIKELTILLKSVNTNSQSST